MSAAYLAKPQSVAVHHRGLIARFIDSLQQQGRYSFALTELDAAAAAVSPVARRAALRRLAAAGRVRRVTSHGDFLVIVPHEHATMGAPPVAWFLDDYMRHLGIEYYVGLLSAAEWHGAAHFAVQETQVVAATQIRPIAIGRERVRFFVKRDAAATPVRRMSSGAASILVSSPEATLLDLLRYRDAVGGLNRIVVILDELAPKCRAAELQAALDAANDVPAAQRLGYLLDHAGQGKLAHVVERWLVHRPHRLRPLDPAGPASGLHQRPWNLVINAAIERGVA
jgi:predicted transcriptional regulator of viral defense system